LRFPLSSVMRGFPTSRCFKGISKIPLMKLLKGNLEDFLYDAAYGGISKIPPP
jgi:hypothetical protein